ncbi:MAG: hypothetical protein Q9190_007250 [Brigantiaea leucoxantha]
MPISTPKAVAEHKGVSDRQCAQEKPEPLARSLLFQNDTHGNPVRLRRKRKIPHESRRVDGLDIQANDEAAQSSKQENSQTNPQSCMKPSANHVKLETFPDKESEVSQVQTSTRVCSAEDEQRVRKRLKTSRTPALHVPWETDNADQAPAIPPGFQIELDNWGLSKSKNPDIHNHYRNLPRKDVETHEASKSPLLETLDRSEHQRKTRSMKASRWTWKGKIGEGTYSSVHLWEKPGSRGEPSLKLAIKDSDVALFFNDYHIEGNLIRRLNEIGCNNVVLVVDWLYKPRPAPMFRTCYEYAEFGDLQELRDFYARHKLAFPEAFVWHVFWSMASALCYCYHGHNRSDVTRPGWDHIIHGDVKPANMLLSAPDERFTSIYPTVKLGDFGTAYTVDDQKPKVRAWKSTFTYGTMHFMAPEVRNADLPHGHFGPVTTKRLHGNHSDVYSLGAAIDYFLAPSGHSSFTRAPKTRYYTSRLTKLVAACQIPKTSARPSVYDLYICTRTGMSKHRKDALKDFRKARGDCYHSQVLFSKKDQRRFEKDQTFQKAYREANIKSLLADPSVAGPGPLRETFIQARQAIESAIHGFWGNRNHRRPESAEPPGVILPRPSQNSPASPKRVWVKPKATEDQISKLLEDLPEKRR